MPLSTGILAVDYTLGSESLTHQQLEERFGVDAMRKVLSGAGIRNRRVAAAGVCGSDLAFDAANRLMDENAIDPHAIDLLIHCTQSPDYFLPTTACVLHHRLKLKKECAAFDINLGCSQYIYALSVAHSMIGSGVATRALVLTGDTMTRTINPMDRAVAPLMGDGGSASLIGIVPDGEGFVGFELGTDGSGHSHLMIPAGGFRTPLSAQTAIETADAEGNVRSPRNLYMSGTAIFHFAISTVPKLVQSILAKNAMTMDDIDLVLFHQANQYMLDYLVKKLQIPAEKTHFYLAEIGNTSGSTMPTVLADALRHGKVKRGSRILMVSFGVGLSWAAAIVKWSGSE